MKTVSRHLLILDLQLVTENQLQQVVFGQTVEILGVSHLDQTRSTDTVTEKISHRWVFFCSTGVSPRERNKSLDQAQCL